MINRLASKKICRILQHQIGPNFLKRLSFTNATSWPSHQNGWLRKHGKSRLAVVLLGAAVGVASSIGKIIRRLTVSHGNGTSVSHWSTYLFD